MPGPYFLEIQGFYNHLIHQKCMPPPVHFSSERIVIQKIRGGIWLFCWINSVYYIAILKRESSSKIRSQWTIMDLSYLDILNPTVVELICKYIVR